MASADNNKKFDVDGLLKSVFKVGKKPEKKEEPPALEVGNIPENSIGGDTHHGEVPFKPGDIDGVRTFLSDDVPKEHAVETHTLIASNALFLAGYTCLNKAFKLKRDGKEAQAQPYGEMAEKLCAAAVNMVNSLKFSKFTIGEPTPDGVNIQVITTKKKEK